MIAKRIPSILPPLTLKKAIETTKVHSNCGLLNEEHRFDKPNRLPERACETTTNRRSPSGRVDRLSRGACFEGSGTSLPKRGALGFQGLPLVIRVEKWSRFAVSR
jgi:hypothetical protein